MVPLTNRLKHAAASQNFLGDRWCLVATYPAVAPLNLSQLGLLADGGAYLGDLLGGLLGGLLEGVLSFKCFMACSADRPTPLHSF